MSAKGEISLDISLDSGFDYKLFSGLQSFKFIVKADSKQDVTFNVNGQLKTPPSLTKTKIGTLKFAKIPIPGLPAWVTPQTDVYLFAEGAVGAKFSFGVSFSQHVEGGLLYNQKTGFSVHKQFVAEKHIISPNPPSVSASLKGGLEISPSLKLYDVTGPELAQQIYVKAEAVLPLNIECADVVLQTSVGAQALFKWDLGGSTKIGKFLLLDKLEGKSKFKVFIMEWPYNSITLYNNCPEPTKGAFLVVNGDGIFSTIDLGDANGLASTLTVSNTGDEDLRWNTTNGAAAMSISPSSGVLAPGAEEIVQMSVATADLPVGRYLRKPFFYNEASLGQGLPDEEFGNTRKTVDIIVKDTGVTDTPLITSAVSNEPGQVTLDWDFTPSGSYPVLGFAVYATETPADPDSYKSVDTTNSYDRQTIISGLTPSATYSFKMRVYGNYAPPFGPYSNVVSAQVAGNPPSFIPSALNDTGITWGGDYPSGNNTGCTGVEIGAQDCSHGRDVTHNDDSDGHAGFSYTKLDSNGIPLANQNADYATTPWACVRDNVTGLIWEVKTDDGGLHDKDDTYNWYNTDTATNGGANGYDDYGGDICYGYNSGNSSTFCNTEAYVNRVNAAGWCGASDWRMPTRNELKSLVNYGRSWPAIDTGYFPNTVNSNSYVWSGSPYAGYSDYAWYVYFSVGGSYGGYRDSSNAFRLVRGGQ